MMGVRIWKKITRTCTEKIAGKIGAGLGWALACRAIGEGVSTVN